MKYKTIIRLDYNCEIYDNCTAVLQSNGSRIRVRYDHTYWHNNTGGLTDTTRYYTREQGRKILRALRCARATHDSGNMSGYTPYDIISDGLTSNYNNAPAAIGL